jgi:hypothetical protein
MAEDGLRLTVPLPPVSPAVYKPPFSAFTRPLYLAFMGGGQTWHVVSQEFGLWVQNSSFQGTYLGEMRTGNWTR